MHDKQAIILKNRAAMIRTTSSKQLTIAEFDWPFDTALDKHNRWVKLSACIPWDELAESYYQRLYGGSWSAHERGPAGDRCRDHQAQVVSVGCGNRAANPGKSVPAVLCRFVGLPNRGTVRLVTVRRNPQAHG
jgi:hypothetical protein